MTDLVIASRKRVRLAMEACGPEFSGLLMDVCCFLRGLEESSASGLAAALGQDRAATGARPPGAALRASRRGAGDASARIRTWLAADAGFEG